MKRIGIFAGSFDPIHDGHLEVAKAAIRSLELTKLYFMVEAEPWSDKTPESTEMREQMIALATKDDKKIGILQLPDPRFTISSTLPKLENKLSGSELYFIFGADVFLSMNQQSWPGLEALLQHYIVVFERAQSLESAISNHAKSLGIVVAIIPSKHPHHRSTDVRLKPHEKSVWVPKSVSDFIAANNLYK